MTGAPSEVPAKGTGTEFPVEPPVFTLDERADPADLEIGCTVNGDITASTEQRSTPRPDDRDNGK
ncbi:hypothetical protein [Streptomyces sp. NPDC002769]|uniref:hypothetical protein n=1 Tax=Streptomyces sp. NPDC002769 TaxID=3154542 RepID=UPI0033181726